jgi:putative SOS response-associated peptidase YedK
VCRPGFHGSYKFCAERTSRERGRGDKSNGHDAACASGSFRATSSVGERLLKFRLEPASGRRFSAAAGLIVVDGWHEWETLPGRRKQPYAIGMPDGAPFAFAGLWETWRSPEGEPLTTCTIVTTAANAATTHLHHRMPVVLSPPDFSA